MFKFLEKHQLLASLAFDISIGLLIIFCMYLGQLSFFEGLSLIILNGILAEVKWIGRKLSDDQS